MKNFKLNRVVVIAIVVIIVLVIINSSARASTRTNSTNSTSPSTPIAPGSSVGSTGIPSTGSTGNSGTSGVSNPNNLPSVGKGTVLSRGAYALEVQMIQSAYNRYYAATNEVQTLTEDGQFGTLTEQAIQRSAGVSSISYNEYIASLGRSGYNALSNWASDFFN